MAEQLRGDAQHSGALVWNDSAVVGRSKSEDAKIGGMTPAVLSFSGRCEELPS